MERGGADWTRPRSVAVAVDDADPTGEAFLPAAEAGREREKGMSGWEADTAR